MKDSFRWFGLTLLLFIFALILLSFRMANSVSANGGPLSWPPSGEGPLQFDPHSGINLVKEVISYDVQTNRHDLAIVTIEYVLKNTNAEDKNIDMLFITPVSESDDFLVLNGTVEIPTTTIPDVQIDGWEPSTSMTFVEPISGQSFHYKDQKAATVSSEPPLTGSSFRLAFQAGESKNLKIQYTSYSGIHKLGLVHSTFTHLYYLTPASFWKDTPNVELNISVPNSRFRLHSNIPMIKETITSYQVKLDQLPGKEWQFSLVDSSGLLYGTNDSSTHFTYSLLIVIITTIVVFLIGLLRKQKSILVGGAVVIGLFMYLFFRTLFDNVILNIIAVTIFWLISVIVLGIAFVIVDRKTKSMNKP
ncbi:hypothetical protein [Paenibacillus sp. L3-i20]|uniref:hypothetical protein n=1 Tax=Paenibacillus sp. L3-i20 TaxID=2905833 RepID=UPI001EDCEDFC|nr:hypothetical protein [Paenibacillus sp. L3-i20]GKU78422.1 hypothetical protein L3i20_v228190 [Paenibacillus sp. L3-i20]